MTSSSVPAVIRCDNLIKIYGSPASKIKAMSAGEADQAFLDKNGLVAAVNGVSLEVSPGETLVVAGSSGSGKSTLIRCLTGLIEPSSGTIEIDGRDLLAMGEKELINLRRSKMGMASKDLALLPHKTVLENVAFPLQMRGMKKDSCIKRARQMIELVSLDGLENDFPRQLSEGQQQCIGIARSLAIDPDIWFLDEPFSALHPLIRKEMQDKFLALQKTLNKTIVFITDDFKEALRLADRIVIMRHGCVEQCDTPEIILLNPASEYVRNLMGHMPTEKKITAGDLMVDRHPEDVPANKPVNHSDLIQDIAETVLFQDRPVVVHDEDFNPVGMLHRDTLLKTLLPRIPK